MKIKHWAGYGTVNASRINDGVAKLHVRVTGNHEQGLKRYDEYDLYRWLVKRFDKSVPDYITWMRSMPMIDIREGWTPDYDTCDYYFYY